MKSATQRLSVKIAAIFFLILVELAGAITSLGVYFAYSSGIYDGVTNFYDTSYCRDQTSNAIYNIYSTYMADPSSTYFEHVYRTDNSNLRFGIYDSDGTFLAGNDSNAASSTAAGYTGKVKFDNMTVTCNVVKPIAAHDVFYLYNRLFSIVLSIKGWLIPLALLSVAFFLADLCFLFCAVGHRPGSDTPQLNHQDKIPLDLYLVGVIFAIAIIAEMGDLFYYSNTIETVLTITLVLLSSSVIVLACLLTLATRIKVGKWWRNTIIYRVLRFIHRLFRKAMRSLLRFFHVLPSVWQAALLGCGITTTNLFFVVASANSGMWFLLYFLLNTACTVFLCLFTSQMQRLEHTAAALAMGSFEKTVNTDRMFPPLQRHGEHLNSIGQGLSIAVDQKMKSERLKTELITNVSHDIKTPLTSIINYVDLLQKEHTPQQEAEYLTVLSRQSHRLKKLTEDLVEASKASTGNLSVTLIPTNLQELFDQSIAEYQDRLDAGKLELILTMPENGLSVQADGRLLWRVLDNLLNNVCKYAQPQTRVYLDARKAHGQAMISMKNVSRQQLNVSAEELMERFVRGDSARNTEGSGLGLNIAKSLVELQKGIFSLKIDGDLFKAEISLPLSPTFTKELPA